MYSGSRSKEQEFNDTEAYHMSEKFNADTDQMKHEMPSVINAVLQCYGGDCSDCAEKSAGNCAGGDSDNWFVRSR